MKGKFASGSKASKGFAGIAAFVVVALLVGGVVSYYAYQVNPTPLSKLPKYSSCSALSQSFREAQQKSQNYYMLSGGMMRTFALGAPTAMAESAAKDASGAGGVQYSETNIQVAGVDEADIVKTDGEYIYTVTGGGYYYGGGSKSRLVIAKAYPADEAAILSETDLGDFYPQEMFIHSGKVLIFGSTNRQIPMEEEPVVQEGVAEKMIAPPYYRYTSLATVQIFDVSDKASPSLVRSLDFEGSYLSSRKIGPYVYFIVNSYPSYQILESMQNSLVNESGIQEILPVFRDRAGSELGDDTAFVKTCACDDVGYFEPVNPQNFITVASVSMDDPNAEVIKQTIVGSGQNIYASLSNLYIAEVSYPWMGPEIPQEQTLVHKFSLDNGQISYIGHMDAPGHILNQFSMDEYDAHFRIATTLGSLTRGFASEVMGTTSNNVYVFAGDLSVSGRLENIAPGESIYSARFMGERGYLVTFKKIDPFFVLDLSDHANPRILGKLKIPGYSDYLHPYDENHIIGIGKEAIEAESEGGQPANFAWYQGVKIALFDVTDVANPKELHKVVIGDRGTDSYALHDHKAFLFDREKNLLVVPILLAEMTEEEKQGKPGWEYGEYKYQGAYVYDLTLENGFQLKGRVTHYDDDQTFLKSGYYYYGDEYSVKRSLYIGDVLYTLSGKKIKLNALADLAEIKQLTFGA
jgi:uncharacterized secreted protein with C-terminal beta-propeller domain